MDKLYFAHLSLPLRQASTWFSLPVPFRLVALSVSHSKVQLSEGKVKGNVM